MGAKEDNLGQDFDALEGLRARAAKLERAEQELHQLEADLRESEERYRTVTELISNWAYAFSIGPGGEIIHEWITEGFRRETGFAPVELVASGTWIDIIHPADREVVQAQLKTLMAGQADVREYRIITKDGQVRWIRNYLRPVWDDQQKRTVQAFGAAQDITERIEAEHAFQRSSRLLETLHEIDIAILGAQTLEEITDAVLDRIRRLIPAQRTDVTLFDLPAKEVVFLNEDLEGDDYRLIGERVPFDDWTSLAILQDGEIFVIDDTQDLLPKSPPDIIRKLGFRSGFMTPMLVQGDLIGSLNFGSDLPGAFDESHYEIAKEVANSLAIGIQQARLHESERAERLATQALVAFARDLSAILDLGRIFDLTLDRIQEVVPYDSAALLLLRDGGADLVASRGLSDLMGVKADRAAHGDVLPLEREIIVTCEPLILDDVRQDDRWCQLDSMQSTRSWLGVPIMTGPRVLGLMMLDKIEPRFYSAAMADKAAAFAAHVAIAIQNARLFAAERQQAEQLEALRQVGVGLTAQLDLDNLLETIVRRAVGMLGGQSGGVYLCRPERNTLEWALAIGPNMAPVGTLLQRGEGISGRVWETGSPVIVNDYRSWPDKAQIYEDYPWVSVIAVPLSLGEEFLGVLDVLSDTVGAFGRQDIEMLSMFAVQAAVAIDNARLFEQVRIGRERLQMLSQQLLDVQEKERRRIALELHDQIGQTLTAVKINLQAAQQASPAISLGDPIEQNIAIVERALQQVRNLSLDLRPSMLDDLGLVAALRWYVDRQAQQGNFIAEFHALVVDERPDATIETACFRVAQEALTNILRHAQAQQVVVEVRMQDQELQMMIQDDGLGFDVDEAIRRATRGESMGLLGMLERVHLLGGEIDIHSVVGQGTTLRVRFPLDLSQPLERRKHRRSV